MLDAGADQSPSLRGHLDRVHPADRVAVRRGLFRALRKGGRHAVAHPLLRPDRRQRAVRCSVEALAGQDGRVSAAWDGCHDITDADRRGRHRRTRQRPDARWRGHARWWA